MGGPPFLSPKTTFPFTKAFQQDRRGFVVGVLGDEFAAEGFGEDGLRELVNVRFRLAVTRFERVGGFEECFDAADDFLLFGKWRYRNKNLPNSFCSLFRIEFWFLFRGARFSRLQENIQKFKKNNFRIFPIKKKKKDYSLCWKKSSLR